MKKLKMLVVIICFILLMFLCNTKVNAAETFKTSNGITATKIVQSTNGDIEFKFSNITLSPEGSYTWAISRTSSYDAKEYSNNLGDFSLENKTALIALTTSQEEIWQILRETNTAYLFIKDEKTNNFIVNSLKVDLTLPALSAFKVTKGRYNIAYVLTKGGESIDYTDAKRNSTAKATYDIKNMYFKFVKITDSKIIDAYHKAKDNGTGLQSISGLANLNQVPDSGWITASNESGMYNTKIRTTDVPTQPGVYYLWLKGKDSDTKMVLGYTLIEVEGKEDGPKVTDIWVRSPVTGTYKTGQTIKILASFNKKITGTLVPTLKIKFGNGEERSITNGTIHGNESYIEYSYNIQPTDKGQLSTVSFTGGNIVDTNGNSAILSCPIISGSIIKANVDGTTTNNTPNQDKDNTNNDNKNDEDNNGNKDNNEDKNNNTNNGNEENKGNNNTNNNNNSSTTNKNDTTIAGKLPKTGVSMMIVIAIIIALATGVFGYIKYNNYKDIK